MRPRSARLASGTESRVEEDLCRQPPLVHGGIGSEGPVRTLRQGALGRGHHRPRDRPLARLRLHRDGRRRRRERDRAAERPRVRPAHAARERGPGPRRRPPRPARWGRRRRRRSRRPLVGREGRGAVRWLREPLVHFLLLGAGIFALASLVGDRAGGPEGRIRLGPADVELLRQGFERTWRRPPTPAELAGLVEERVREEVYYREALALGLDRDDTIVRRRLRQKLEFLAEDRAVSPPTDADLEAWLRANPARFRNEPRVRFEQVFLSRDRRGERLRADAEALLARLRADARGADPAGARGADPAGAGSADPAALGDPLPLPAGGGEFSQSELAARFGSEFAGRVFELEPGGWQGPIDSAFGAHLVLVRERSPGREPALAEVREAVSRAWIAEARSRAREELYRELRARYDVEIELPTAPGVGAAAAATP